MPRRWRRGLYGGMVVVLFAAIAVWRFDLFSEALSVTLRQIRAGGPARWRVLAEAALLSGILALTWRVLLVRADLAFDAITAATAVCAGLAAEAWGTRFGLWTYYTGEKPPLWIIPAWPLGALVVGRLGGWAERRWGGGLGAGAWRAGYWLLAGLALAASLAFLRPWLRLPSATAVLALMGALLCARPAYRRDFWILAAGLLSVFLADAWGTTNGCWRYYTQKGGGGGLAAGISFGMAFDTVLVLGCLKLAAVFRTPESRPPGK